MQKTLRAARPLPHWDKLKAKRLDRKMQRRIEDIKRRYEEPRASLLPILWECQNRWGYISPEVQKAVAEALGLSASTVQGVVTFYTMFHTSPPGKHVLEVCSTLSCHLSGAGELAAHLRKRLGIEFGETTEDGLFTLVEVQCLGACDQGPVLRVDETYHGRMTPRKVDRLLSALREEDNA